MDTITVILYSIQIGGGIFVLIPQFTRRYLSAAPRWIRVLVVLGGLLVLGIQPFAFYLHGLRANDDPAYWRFVPLLEAVRLAAIATLAPSIIHFIHVRISKSGRA